MTTGIGLYLLAAHLVGDFILQEQFMRENKHDSHGIRTLHVALYLSPFVPVVMYAGWPPLASLALIGALHWVTDIQLWVEPAYEGDNYPYIVDQTLHVVQLALVAAIFST